MLPVVMYAMMLELEKEYDRRLERKKLCRAIQQEQGTTNINQKIAGWLGTKLVNWGSKLQGTNAPAPPTR